MTASPDNPVDRMIRWLEERATRRRIQELFPLDEETSTPQLDDSDASFDPDPRPADIRLLASRPGIPLARTPVYILVLGQNADGSFEVAPFSRFTQPATSGEFLILPPDDAIIANREFRTVCLWNSFRLPAAALARSWKFASLPEPDFEAVHTVAAWLRSASFHDPLDASRLPDDLRRRIGPPVSKLRGIALFEVVEYLAEEEAWTWELANPELAAAPEAALDEEEEEEAESPVRLTIPWQDLLQNVARVPAGFGSTQDLARRFAVWLCDAPVGQFLRSADTTTLRLWEAATRAWEKTPPSSESTPDAGPGLLSWETLKNARYLHDTSSMEPTYGFLGGPPRSIRGSYTIEHTPDLPANQPALLLDAQTSRLLGLGKTSKEGIRIQLLTPIPENAALQIVLCNPEDQNSF